MTVPFVAAYGDGKWPSTPDEEFLFELTFKREYETTPEPTPKPTHCDPNSFSEGKYEYKTAKGCYTVIKTEFKIGCSQKEKDRGGCDLGVCDCIAECRKNG